MCILSYLPPHVPVDEDGLFNGGLHNPDGHGWAITAGDEILVGKSLELVDALDDFLTARAKHPEGHALFHSRWATHGSVRTDNVHPFYVGGSQRTVVAHNGILPRSAWPAKGDGRSDTRLFADEILSTRYRRLDKARAQQALANWIGTGNKLVILTVDPRYRRNAYLVNPHVGHWDKKTGIWHSNWDHETSPSWMYTQAMGPKTTTRALATVTATSEDLCYICEVGTVSDTGYCRECGSCADCMETKADCNCWSKYTWKQEDWAQRYWDGDDTIVTTVPKYGRTASEDYE